MIVNSLYECTLKELEENIKVIRTDGNTMNIFIDGRKTPHVMDTTHFLFNALNIYTGFIKEGLDYDEAVNCWCHIFEWTAFKNIEKLNIIIKNCDEHHKVWNQLNKSAFEECSATKTFYSYICKYYEHQIIAKVENGKRRSFDVYFCVEDFDIEDFKRKMNGGSKKLILELIAMEYENI